MELKVLHVNNSEAGSRALSSCIPFLPVLHLLYIRSHLRAHSSLLLPSLDECCGMLVVNRRFRLRRPPLSRDLSGDKPNIGFLSFQLRSPRTSSDSANAHRTLRRPMDANSKVGVATGCARVHTSNFSLSIRLILVLVSHLISIST